MRTKGFLETAGLQKSMRITIEEDAQRNPAYVGDQKAQCYKCGGDIPIWGSTTKSAICPSCGTPNSLAIAIRKAGPSAMRPGGAMGYREEAGYPPGGSIAPLGEEDQLRQRTSGGQTFSEEGHEVVTHKDGTTEHLAGVCRTCLRQANQRRWKPSQQAKQNHERMLAKMDTFTSFEKLRKSYDPNGTNLLENSLWHKMGLKHNTKACRECDGREPFHLSTIA